MFNKNKMHALAALLLCMVIAAAGTLGSVQYVFARTIEFVIDTGESKKAEPDTANLQTNTVTKKGTVAGISYDKLVMANVQEAVNVRSDASEDSSIIGKFYKDCGGEIIEKKANWTKLKTGDLTGWVRNDYLMFGDEAVKLAQSVVEKTAVSNADSLRVREAPNTDSRILSVLAKGDKIGAIATEGDWVKVEFSDGTIGYVSSEFVTIEDSLDCGESMETIRAKEEALAKEKKEKEAEERRANQELKAPDGVTNNGAITGDINETLLLAALIEAEGGNQPYEGQVSIGTVVMNRLKLGKYGNSIYNVIYAKGQFGVAASGKLAKVYARGPKASCIQAATDALNGVSYIGMATHFRNTSSGYSGIVIGNHVFW